MEDNHELQADLTSPSLPTNPKSSPADPETPPFAVPVLLQIELPWKITFTPTCLKQLKFKTMVERMLTDDVHNGDNTVPWKTAIRGRKGLF